MNSQPNPNQPLNDGPRLTLRELFLSVFLLATALGLFRFAAMLEPIPGAPVMLASLVAGVFALGAGVAILFCRLTPGRQFRLARLILLGGFAALGWALLLGCLMSPFAWTSMSIQ